MAEAKHAFVDDNPYLVYSPNAETTSEGGSGGGSGAGFPVIEANAETGALSVTAAALKTMLDTSPVILHTQQGNNPNIMWITLLAYFINDGEYLFVGSMIDTENKGLILVNFKADTASDYPTPYQG